jgi:hypothetical protein
MASRPDKSNFQYVDRPDLTETFTDSVGKCTAEDGVFHLELLMCRYDTPKPPKPPTGHFYPAARLAMSIPTAISLYNQLRQLMDTLEKQGVLESGPHSSSKTIQ